MNNNKIVSTKTTSAIFLAIVLVAGTIAISSPSFMIGTAQAQPYYGGGMDNSYDKSYGKDNRDKSKDSVNVKKVKCNNINVNVNGIPLNVTSFPFLSGIADDDADRSEGKYDTASYGSGGSYGGHSDKDKDGFTFVCINNNNNTVIGGNETTPPTPPPPPPVELANLNVIKNVACRTTNPPNNPGVCDYVLANISPSDYNMTVSGNNPNPSEFPGSSSGTNVQLGAGAYILTEDVPSTSQLQTDLGATSIITTTAVDSGSDCVGFFNVNNVFQNANATISAGESQICSLTNTIIVNGGTAPSTLVQSTQDSPELTTLEKQPEDSPIGSQGIGDTHELTTMEKLTQLKTQWLSQLP